tara:strand:+ start:1003 stop:1467 length:465 start_codon:yes stop_codon:yes gene_type:complete
MKKINLLFIFGFLFISCNSISQSEANPPPTKKIITNTTSGVIDITRTTLEVDILQSCYDETIRGYLLDKQNFIEFDGNSLFIDGEGDTDLGWPLLSELRALRCILPENIISQINKTTGPYSKLWFDYFDYGKKSYEVSWRYSSSRGLDILIKER